MDTSDTGLSIAAEGAREYTEFIKYTKSLGTTLITEPGTETRYTLTLNDSAGNSTTIEVYIDKSLPVGQWLGGSEELENNGYTNKELRFSFFEPGVTAKYSYNGGEYSAYTRRIPARRLRVTGSIS